MAVHVGIEPTVFRLTGGCCTKPANAQYTFLLAPAKGIEPLHA